MARSSSTFRLAVAVAVIFLLTTPLHSRSLPRDTSNDADVHNQDALHSTVARKLSGDGELGPEDVDDAALLDAEQANLSPFYPPWPPYPDWPDLPQAARTSPKVDTDSSTPADDADAPAKLEPTNPTGDSEEPINDESNMEPSDTSGGVIAPADKSTSPGTGSTSSPALINDGGSNGANNNKAISSTDAPSPTPSPPPSSQGVAGLSRTATIAIAVVVVLVVLVVASGIVWCLCRNRKKHASQYSTGPSVQWQYNRLDENQAPESSRR